MGRWFSFLDFIFAKTYEAECRFKELRQQNPGRREYAWLEAAAHNAWLKCEQYYKHADESPAYYAADVLQPGRKWSWFEQEWGNDLEKRPWLDMVKESVRTLWEEEYMGKFTSEVQLTRPPRPRSKLRDEEYQDILEHGQVKVVQPAKEDQYKLYITSDPLAGNPDPLEYWNSHILTQPDLAHFALDMLALPMSSAECERVFSSSKLLITDIRSRLLPDIIEANECLKSWYGASEEEDVGKPEGFNEDTEDIAVESEA